MVLPFRRTRHLRLTLAASAAAFVAAVLVGWLVSGGVGLLGAGAGVLLVAASYTASTLAIAWADSVSPRLVFPVGMGMYVTKFSLFGGMLIAVDNADWAGKIPMAWGIVAGVLAWTTAQIWWTARHAYPNVAA